MIAQNAAELTTWGGGSPTYMHTDSKTDAMAMWNAAVSRAVRTDGAHAPAATAARTA